MIFRSWRVPVKGWNDEGKVISVGDYLRLALNLGERGSGALCFVIVEYSFLDLYGSI